MACRGKKRGEETRYEAAAKIRSWVGGWGSGQRDGLKGPTFDGMLFKRRGRGQCPPVCGSS